MIHVVLPAYNEEEAIGPLLNGLGDVAQRRQVDLAVIVVDDGSGDRTAERVRGVNSVPVTLIQHDRNRGLSETIKTGLLAAIDRADPRDVIVTMDADNTHNPGLIFRMSMLVDEGNDVVIASRYVYGARVVGLSAWRRLMSRGAGILLRLCFPIPGVRDYTCGYRAYRSAKLKAAFEQWHNDLITRRGFSCMVEILLKLREMGAICTEVPLVLRYDLKPGASKMNVGRTVMDTLAVIFRHKRCR